MARFTNFNSSSMNNSDKDNENDNEEEDEDHKEEINEETHKDDDEHQSPEKSTSPQREHYSPPAVHEVDPKKLIVDELDVNYTDNNYWKIESSINIEDLLNE